MKRGAKSLICLVIAALLFIPAYAQGLPVLRTPTLTAPTLTTPSLPGTGTIVQPTLPGITAPTPTPTPTPAAITPITPISPIRTLPGTGTITQPALPGTTLPGTTLPPITKEPILDIQVFSAPTELAAIKTESNLVSLQWKDNSTTETTFAIERKKAGEEYSRLAAVGQNIITYDDTTVQPGTTYYYRVRAGKNSSGGLLRTLQLTYSDYSNEIMVTTPAAPGRVILDPRSGLGGITLPRGGLPPIGGLTGTGTDTGTGTGTGTETGTGTGAGTEPGTGENTAEVILAPTELNAELRGENEIALSWQDKSNNEEGFLMYRTCTDAWEEPVVLDADTTSYSDKNPQPDTTYYYVVLAYKGENGSECSNVVEIKTPAAAVQVVSVAAPEGLSAKSEKPTEVTLSWEDKASNEDGFILYRATTGEYEEVAQLDADTTSYKDKTVKANTKYYYCLIAYAGDIASEASQPAEVTTPNDPAAVLAAPQNLSAKAQSPTEVVLTWEDKSDGEEGFVLYRNPPAEWEQAAIIPANTVTYTDKAAKANTNYQYVIYAYKGETASTESNIAQVTTQNQAAAPPAIDFAGASGWALEELNKAVEYGLYTDTIMNNYSQNITREEFCELVIKLYEKLKGSEAVPASPNPFRDTMNTSILKAYGAGIVRGTGADTFSPSNSILRQDICVMLYRAVTGAVQNVDTNISGVPAFADENLIGSWAIKEVKFAYRNNIMKGSNNMIMPRDNTNREQALLLVKRVYEAFAVK